MHRLFIAIDLPQTVKRELTTICGCLPGARWVENGQLHLTLCFIGEVDDGVFQNIRKELADVKSSAFAMRLVGLSYFPPRRQPHVLWVGVDPIDPIITLHVRVESVLTRLGFQPEKRKFSPHVTLARLRHTPTTEINSYLAGKALFTSSEFEIDAFYLYSSILTKNGAIHHIEASYPLTPAANASSTDSGKLPSLLSKGEQQH